jgi:hypothetical protein
LADKRSLNTDEKGQANRQNFRTQIYHSFGWFVQTERPFDTGLDGVWTFAVVDLARKGKSLAPSLRNQPHLSPRNQSYPYQVDTVGILQCFNHNMFGNFNVTTRVWAVEI